MKLEDIRDMILEADPAAKHVSMSFFTAISLSLNNLMTKKGRTILTAFAGSIGIIGIALILALSTGINTYINQVQEDTLSSYPITIEAESIDMSQMMASMMGKVTSVKSPAGVFMYVNSPFSASSLSPLLSNLFVCSTSFPE